MVTRIRPNCRGANGWSTIPIARRPNGWILARPDRPHPVPADAIVLFDGKNLSQWQSGQGWKIDEGTLVSGDGMFTTRENFGDAQFHVEFMTPANFESPWYNRGNNGVMLMGLFEESKFSTRSTKSYIPMANALPFTARRLPW